MATTWFVIYYLVPLIAALLVIGIAVCTGRLEQQNGTSEKDQSTKG